MSDGLNDIRRRIVEVSYQTKEGHIASAFSILNILDALYGEVLRMPAFPGDAQRDIFILSKGHASIGLYAILEKYGLLGEGELDYFGGWGSRLGGHPDKNKAPCVEASTGSLGHGFPMAVGYAMGSKIKRIGNKVITLVGDGELNEGSMWEAALLAKEHGLDNLYCIVDYNHSTDRALDISDINKKFGAFGWDVVEIDGHNAQEITDALGTMGGSPLAIVANTIKGYGCARMENNPEWHHKSPNRAEFEQIMEELA